MNETVNDSYCFIGGICFDHQMNEIKSSSKCGLQNAPNAFQLAFIDGLRSNVENLDVINLPFIGAYPLNYKKIIGPKTERFNYKNSKGLEIKCNNHRFINLIYFKLYLRERVCFNALSEYYKAHKDSHHIYLFIYSIHLPFLKAAIKLKKRHKNVKIITIVTDLPEFKNDTTSRWKQWLYNYDTHVDKKTYDAVDGYILISKHMAPKVISNNQPYVIIEGIYNPNDNNETTVCESDKKTIFYSGTLARRYNIMTLVKAFQELQGDEYRLIICGAGSCKDEILKVSKLDSRIEFKGEVSRTEVLHLQRTSSLLVNPRTNEGDYTNYSFPSKTMEYLASGTPTLLYKLGGIPDEYYDNCFAISDPSVQNLKESIEMILNLPASERVSIGQKAKKFILGKKTSDKQCQKAIDLINSINQNAK